eukprot:TRINITY_DN19887_c0_g1_i1.p1 TRINITY_DN19887_c0_g1~~TRINITY_DN19887_c0_g1_i1.p1  ORF type:complete len:471 (-),score=36.07 TRINITY_DN19887_c0_g1_i1:348-1760(-)
MPRRRIFSVFGKASSSPLTAHSSPPAINTKCVVCRHPTDRQCGRCKNEYYCSQRCLVKGWRAHEPTCGRKSEGLTGMDLNVLVGMLEVQSLPVRCFLVLRCVSKLISKASELACHSLKLRRVETAEQLRIVARIFPDLRILDLTNSRQLRVTQVPLFSRLTEFYLHNMSHLSSTVIQSLAACPHLQVLSVPGCVNLDDQAFQDVSRHRHLRALDVAGCFNLTDVSMGQFAECVQLRKLDISRCRFTSCPSSSTGDQSMLTCLFAADCTELESVGVLERAHHMDQLDLSSCWRVAPEQVGEACVSIRELTVNVCPWFHPAAAGCRGISDQTLLSLADANPRELRVVSIAGCNRVTPVGVLALAERSCSLGTLHLDGCRLLGDEFIARLTEICGGTLVSLSLSGLPITDKALSWIQEGCRLDYLVWRDGRQLHVHGYDPACLCQECVLERQAKQLTLKVLQPRAASQDQSAR